MARCPKQEADKELLLDILEEDELHELRTSGDFVGASDVLAKILKLPE